MDLNIIYPKPYSIYLRGTTDCRAQGLGCRVQGLGVSGFTGPVLVIVWSNCGCLGSSLSFLACFSTCTFMLTLCIWSTKQFVIYATIPISALVGLVLSVR